MLFATPLWLALLHTLKSRAQHLNVRVAERIFARPHSAFDFSNSIEKLHHGFLIATRCLIRELGDGCLQRRNASGFTVDVYSDFVASRLHDQSREVFRSLWPPLWIARRALAKLRALWRFTAADLRLKPTYDFLFLAIHFHSKNHCRRLRNR